MSAPHTLIVGVTLSGKTTLARYFARHLCKAGKKVVVYDPVGTDTLGGAWGESALVFDDQLSFLDWMHDPKNGNAHVFVDESDELFSISDKDLHWMFKRGRHYGFVMWPITQRPKLIAPTVRNQCGQCFMFRLAQDDAKELGADFGHSNISRYELDQGDYLVLSSGRAEILRGNVFADLKPTSKGNAT